MLSSDTGALSVCLGTEDAGDSFAQVHRSGLDAQESSDVDGVEIAKATSRYLIPAVEGRQAARGQ